ncbi:enoyl-CoA hydratase [Verminephrobacter aporrectodeae subsp. tuberculatae]|uniref:enoyl-CoA hydratase n=1 Tax=Verminephrobacter aporrectodeae TaxID=1110389 RepID=UPI0002375EB7|nr:enoyl-CoA hydratase [Verminephrobacter aporrectodeae]MCW8164942.1 enoyl-CoA hydratase [Verminephrobacter aporrectodeae subsp. tuberculatae]MCW8167890.1 enoyl-CoA hydratase [Verminephrobacter aporrectodeae subsp. tuberculatae]
MNETTKDILVHTEAGVSSIRLHRLERKNAVTAAMYAAMADALDAARDDAQVRVLIFHGDTTVFSAGNDIGDFLQQPPASQDAHVFRFLHALATFPKPLIAAVCGPAVGIGTTLLLHCDLVYAGENAVFSMPFVNLGLCPEAASSLLVPQLMGYHRAAEALLLGEPFTAGTALELGLVNRVLAPAECLGVAQAQARKLAAKPLASLIETKRLMKSGQTAQVLAAMAQEASSFGRLLREPAAREALSAFMQKRQPDFSAVP